MRPHLSRPHRRQYRLGAQEGRLQVDHDGPVEIVFGEFVDAAHDRDAGIVDENVDRAEVARDLLDHLRDGRGLRDIGRHCDRAATAGLDPCDDGFRVIRALAIIDRDRGAEFRERQCNRGANAARAARHQRDARAQILFAVIDPDPRTSLDEDGRRHDDLTAADRSPRRIPF